MEGPEEEEEQVKVFITSLHHLFPVIWTSNSLYKVAFVELGTVLCLKDSFLITRGYIYLLYCNMHFRLSNRCQKCKELSNIMM